MSKALKMADVARAASVSSMTVSRAFRRDSSVDKVTRARILRTAQELGYVFDSTASTLRSQKTGFVAVIIPSLNNANFADTVAALTDALSADQLQILLGYTNYSANEEERLVEQLLQRRPEALVLCGGRHTRRTRTLVARSGIPVVEIWDFPRQPLGHRVGFSNANAMQSLVEHLVVSGRTRLAFIGGEPGDDDRGVDRRRGFLQACRRWGLSDMPLIPAGPAPISMREGATAMALLLDQNPAIEAVLCVSDLVAFGALSECQRRQLQVPEEIAIAGFGAFEISAVAVPTITTVNAFSREIGQRSGELLVRLLRRPDATDATSGDPLADSTVVSGWRVKADKAAGIRHDFQVTPRLVVRQSTGGG